ncbi:EAL domain-containing protein [Ammoniphilus sp. YIM 78166]|uniref:EAL domain-containing protein n=1 Tax=Ammoniphilus sp. YIM 78166 TaxID=1644106 RepID=UPI00107047EC|nr:EAL domain-containing protein [Ammoniphilus sp. YIM 78166]
MLHTASFAQPHWRNILLLIVMGFLGNIYGISLFFGVGIIFSSVAVLLILRIYGPLWGILSGFIIYSSTLILWQHPYAFIILISEVVFLSLFIRRKAGRNLLFWDGLFWFFLGAPLTWLCYHHVIGMNETFSLVILLKHCVNGLFNALVAGLLLEFGPFRRWFLPEQATDSLQKKIFHLIVSFILFPTLILILYEGYDKVQHVKQEMEISIVELTATIQDELLHWQNQHLTPLRKLAIQQTYQPVPPDQLSQNLELITQSFPQFTMMYAADEEAKSYAFYPNTNERGESLIGLTYEDRVYFQELKKSNEPIMSDVLIAKGSPYPIVALAMPLMKEKQFIGYIAGALSLDSVRNQILQKVTKPGYTVTIIDSKKQVIMTNEPHLRPLDSYEASLKKLEENRLWTQKRIQIWQPSETKLPPMLQWEKSFYWKHSPMDTPQSWSIIVKGSVSPYQTEVYELYIKIFSICLLILVLTQPLSFLLSRRIVSPIEHLSQITGNLSLETHGPPEGVSWPKTSIKEIQVLVDNFQFMSKKIQQSKQHLEYLAHHDELTGLSNRYHFKEQFQQFSAKRQDALIAILFIDLDRFKFINDAIGHDFGDLLLQQMADRMKQECGEQGIIARYGGDEFLVMIPNITYIQEVDAMSKRLLEQIQKPFHLRSHEFVVTGSMGISVYPHDGLDIKTLIKHADTAMYAAKEHGKNQYQFFNSNMNDSIMYKLELETELRKAIEDQQLELHYQPQFAIQTGEISGIEALLRWNHPTMGVISPAEFIPLAEETGLIIPIGDWVLREACTQRKKWQLARFPSLRMAVNVSMKQFLHEDFIPNLRRLILETEMDPSKLKLEITESIAMKHPDYVIEKLTELKRLGIKLAIDDFGTGYSSLNYLKEFPVDYLKIDRTFIQDIVTGSAQTSIVQSIIQVAHSLNLSIIAEGVETDQQLEFLKKNHCNEAQGYLLSKPLRSEDIEKYYFQLLDDLQVR